MQSNDQNEPQVHSLRKKRCWCPIAVALIFVLNALSVPAASYGDDVESSEFPSYKIGIRANHLRSFGCGPCSVIVLLRAENIEVEATDVQEILKLATPKGSSLDELGELLKSFGLHVAPMRLSPKSLKNSRLRAIVQLDGYSFAAVLGYSSRGVQLQLPLESVQLMTDEEFQRRFSGYALLVSKRPIRTSTSPSSRSSSATAPTGISMQGPIAVSRSLISVGRVPSKTWTAKLELTNQTDEPIHISAKTSCTCVQVEVRDFDLLPHESRAISITGIERKVGGFTYSLLISTDHPSQKHLVIPIRGSVNPPVVFVKPEVRYEGIRKGETFSLSRTFIPQAGLELDSLRIDVAPDTAPINAKLSEAGNALNIEWTGTSETGWHRFQIAVRDSGAPVERTLREGCIHGAVYVKPNLECFPKSLLVSGKTGKWRRTLEITSLSDRDIKDIHDITWTPSEVSKLLKVTATIQDAKRARLTIESDIEKLRDLLPDRGATLGVTVGKESFSVPVYR